MKVYKIWYIDTVEPEGGFGVIILKMRKDISDRLALIIKMKAN